MSAQIETDVLAGLDFDFEVPCEAKCCSDGDVQCSLTARWKAAKACCDVTFLCCDAYRAYARQEARCWACVDCGGWIDPPKVPIGFTPIGATS